MTEIMNATTSVTTALGSFTSWGWIVTLLVFLASIMILIILFRNFRRVIIGSVFSGGFLIIYKISRWIGVSVQENNYIPLKWFVYIFIFVCLSWLFGYLIEKTKFYKKLEKKLK